MANPDATVANALVSDNSQYVNQREAVLTWSHISVECYPSISLFDRIRRRKPKVPPPLLDDLSGIARPEEILAIMGTSGVGKTTLLNFLSGQNDPRTTIGRGEVRINGYLTDRKERQNGSIIGHVQQHEPFLDLMSLHEHLIFQVCT